MSRPCRPKSPFRTLSFLLLLALVGLASTAMVGCGFMEGKESGGNRDGAGTWFGVKTYVPENRSQGVYIDPEILMTFDRELDRSTVDNTTVLLEGPYGSLVGGTARYSYGVSVGGIFWSTILRTPPVSETLLPGTEYRVTLADGIRSTFGASLTPFTWSFTTMGNPPPIVVARVPAKGAVAFPPLREICVTLDRELNPGTVDNTTVKVGRITPTGVDNVPVSVKYLYADNGALNQILAFPKDNSWEAGNTYSVTLGTGIRTVDGAYLPASSTWTFTAGAGGGVFPAGVSATFPPPGSTAVLASQVLSVACRDELNRATVDNTSVTVVESLSGKPVAVSVGYVYADNGVLNRILAFPKSGSWTAGTAYDVTLGSGIRKSDGTALLSAPYTWTFTTAGISPADVAGGFKVLSTRPSAETPDASLNQLVFAVVDTKLDASTVNASTVTVTTQVGFVQQSVPATVSYRYADGGAVNQILVVPPGAAWTAHAPYTVTLGTGIRTTGGASLASPYSWSFSTEP